MPHTRRTSIAAKLTRVNLLVSGAGLLLAVGALGVYDRTTARTAAVQTLSIQAQIIGSNSVTALVFNDPSAAGVTLAALSGSPNIVSASIRTLDGRVFASYPPGAAVGLPARSAITAGVTETSDFGDREVTLARAISFEGKPLGSVVIASDYRELNARRNQYFSIAVIVLAISLLAALLISRILQRAISAPIAHLAAIARRVSTGRDYSVRAQTGGAGAVEIGVMVDAFNDMLTEIEARDRSLRDAQDDLERRVQRRTAALDAANQELEAFSYSVSHDLRAPLRHVTGFAELLEQHAGDRLDDEGRRYLRTITKAAHRMGQLVDDLLTFSRMGRGHFAKRRVSLNDLMQDARQEVVSQSGSGRDIEWCVGDLPDVEADPAMLRLVLVNLLSNAVKYSSTRAPARIEIGSIGDGVQEVVVFVRDNGVGFDMQYAHKLFGVFQRLHNSDEFEGTGIGLANVKRIVTRHNGRVWAESQLDHGTTFSFSLPTQSDGETT